MDPSISDGKGGFVPNPEQCKVQSVKRVGNLPASSSTGIHTADPLPLFAFGAGAKNFFGTMDQVDVFFTIAKALGLNPARETR